MSVVTTVVFITEDYRDADRFKEIIREKYTGFNDPYEPSPVESHGPKVAHGYLFYEGFNYLDGDCLDALKAEQWKDKEAVLWTVLEEWNPYVSVGSVMVAEGDHPDAWYWKSSRA